MAGKPKWAASQRKLKLTKRWIRSANWSVENAAMESSPGEVTMHKINALTKTLAIAGTILVWLPVLAPVLVSLWLFIQRGDFHFDYLIPAEVFPIFARRGIIAALGGDTGEKISEAYRIGAIWGLCCLPVCRSSCGIANRIGYRGDWNRSVGSGLLVLGRSSFMTWQSSRWGWGESC